MLTKMMYYPYSMGSAKPVAEHPVTSTKPKNKGRHKLNFERNFIFSESLRMAENGAAAIQGSKGQRNAYTVENKRDICQLRTRYPQESCSWEEFKKKVEEKLGLNVPLKTLENILREKETWISADASLLGLHKIVRNRKRKGKRRDDREGTSEVPAAKVRGKEGGTRAVASATYCQLSPHFLLPAVHRDCVRAQYSSPGSVLPAVSGA